MRIVESTGGDSQELWLAKNNAMSYLVGSGDKIISANTLKSPE